MTMVSEQHAAVLEAMQKDLLILLVEKLGGDVTIPLKELDEGPVGKGLAMKLNPDNSFTFQVIEINVAQNVSKRTQ